jgi:hypothetical protein
MKPALAPNMALQRTRRPRIRSGRSLRSLGLPLNARPLGVPSSGQRPPSIAVTSPFAVQAGRSSLGGK